MANWVGIQCSDRGARLIWVDVVGDDVWIRRVGSVRLAAEPSADDTSPRSSSSVVRSVGGNDRIVRALRESAASLASWRIGKTPVVVTLDRAACELRVLDVPPVPAEELPDLVRFQAIQQFTTVNDNGRLDFVTLPAGSRPRVLAAALTSERLAHISECCESAGLNLRSVLLSPCGIVSIMDRQLPRSDTHDTPAARMIVETDGETAGVTVASGASMFMTRSLPLGTAVDVPPAQRMETMVTGLRRTLAAARSQFADHPVTSVVICGDTDFHHQLRDTCAQDLGLAAECIDPLSACRWSDDASESAAGQGEQFASLVGAILDRVQPIGDSIDFLHPRRPPAPTDYRPVGMAIASALLAGGLVAAVFWWWALSARDARLAKLRRDIADVEKLVVVAQRQASDLAQLDEWYANSPNWLLELNNLSRRLPAADQLRLERFQADVTSDGGGRMEIRGVVDESATVAGIETSIRDEQHNVEGLDRKFVDHDPKYPWFFVESISVQGKADWPSMSGEEPSHE